MSFTEQQIRDIVHQELKKIIDMGLMYTETTKPAVTVNYTQTMPTPAPTATSPPLIWEPMPPPKTHPENGPWEKSVQLMNPTLQEIIHQLQDHNGFYSDDLYKYWLLTDQQDKTKINGVGRRDKR